MASSGSNTSGVELEIYRTATAPAQDATISQLSTTISNQNEMEYEAVASQLQPADRGSAAWKLLCAAFVFEALLWGGC